MLMGFNVTGVMSRRVENGRNIQMTFMDPTMRRGTFTVERNSEGVITVITAQPPPMMPARGGD